MVDAALLDLHKENILPLAGGRPVSKLAQTLANSPSTPSSPHTNHPQTLQREEYEKKLTLLDECDDPLQVYCDYIEWTHTAFPQGSNAASGLVLLLEKCTLEFRDMVSYKNDPRYLKIWLEYKDYSDSPRDIFIYLAKKEIGKLLALFYEQFAEFLEVNGDVDDAREVYDTGIRLGARPVNRLTRSYNNFIERTEASLARRKPRGPGLSEKDPFSASRQPQESIIGGGHSRGSSTPSESPNLQKRQKLEIYADSEVHGGIRSIFSSLHNAEEHHIGSIQSRTKENVMKAKAWAGEVLSQKYHSSAPNSSGSATSTKIPVYRDVPVSIPTSVSDTLPTYRLVRSVGGHITSKIEVDGKKPEIIHLNLDDVYTPNEEFCLDELLARRRLWEKKAAKEEARAKEVRAKSAAQEEAILGEVKESVERVQLLALPENANISNAYSQSVIIPLKDEDDDSTLPQKPPNSPTLTMFSRMATNEVLNMFNNAAHIQSDTEDTEREKDDTTNYDGFVTETINLTAAESGSTLIAERAAERDTIVEAERAASSMAITMETEAALATKSLEPTKTPPTDQYDTTASSPFICGPDSHGEGPSTFDPSDEALRTQLLSKTQPFASMPAFHDLSTTSVPTTSNLEKLQSVTHPKTRIIQKGSKESIIKYLGEEILSLRYELGKGGYGTVYLAESETGQLKALKIESPATKWEFYILNEIHRRLDDQFKKMVIKPEALFLFEDESYLILNYINQGTILDVVNFFKNKFEIFEESMIIWISIQLLNIVENLHNIGIIHGDLKADNCMIRLPNDDLENGGITLIDFGRSIDLTLFEYSRANPPKFVSRWKADIQDCPQMNKGTAWNFEADYFGVAGIIHTMLFGKYIEVSEDENGVIKLKNGFKRYWQTELWVPLFHVLLNPGENLPISGKIRSQRLVLEEWLMRKTVSTRLREKIKNVEGELTENNKRLLRSLQ